MSDNDVVAFDQFASNIYSQFGEDGIIAAILGRLPELNKWAVEFGACDGVIMSNSAALADRGWSRVLIEPVADFHAQLLETYGGDGSTVVIRALVGWEPPGTLDDLLRAHPQVPTDFDVLSIDIDGLDYHVWAAVDEYRPKVVLIEFNPTIRNGLEFVQEADPSVHISSSISSYVSLGKTKGYELAATTEVNAIFVRADLFHHLEIHDNSVDALRTDTSWQADVFFDFDGSLHLVGGKGLFWHRVEQPTRIRLVPRIFATYPGNFGRVRALLFAVWRRWRNR